MTTLFLEVQQIDTPQVARDVLRVQQEGLPALSTIGVELVIPASVKQSEWDVFYQGIPHASKVAKNSYQPFQARVRVVDESDARAAWAILKPWFGSAQVTIQLHEHNSDSSCVSSDFDPNA